jgi:enoyl-CoA hydratase
MTLPVYETLSVQWRAPGVLEVRLDRPDKRNAIDLTMHRELVECFRALRSFPDVGAVLLTGAGTMFSAGGSVQMIKSLAAADWRDVVAIHEEAVELVRELLLVGPPIVTAARRAAIGLGATIALLSDVIVASDDLVLADTHVSLGMVAGDGGTLIWPMVLGPARAKEYLLTGRRMSAEDACRWGLVNHVVPIDEVEERALEIATELASGARQAIAWTKKAVNAPILRELMTLGSLSSALEALTMHQPDLREGAAAYIERREPQWPSHKASH